MAYENKIKNLKPIKGGKYNQGYLRPADMVKYRGRINEPIIYRSGLELAFIKYMELCKQVKGWSSEPGIIKYIEPSTQREMSYYPDFVMETMSGVKVIVEVKPFAQTKPPIKGLIDITKQNSPQVIMAMKTFRTNMAKWRAAQEFAKSKGMVFRILTDKWIYPQYKIEAKKAGVSSVSINIR